MNIAPQFATHMDKFLTICRCEVDELDYLNKDNIDHVSEDIVLS